MKFHYYSDTDSLYIDLSEKVGVQSQEVVPRVVLDFDRRSACGAKWPTIASSGAVWSGL